MIIPHSNRNAYLQVIFGLVLAVVGSVALYEFAGESEVRFVWGIVGTLPGIVLALRGLLELAGFTSFVAWRYLLNDKQIGLVTKILIAASLAGAYITWRVSDITIPIVLANIAVFPDMFSIPATVFTAFAIIFVGTVVWGVLRKSRPSFWLWVTGLAIAVAPVVYTSLLARGWLPAFMSPAPDNMGKWLLALALTTLGGIVICGLATFFGTLRAYFTFFTTVPIGGVWIGTSALVCVLSVMSGFENDLRDKILGSNAHVQITKNRGEFSSWEAVKAKIDAVPGVVASTPYAMSEVVVAAHNNGMPVIIKGIDPATVGGVTDLVSDLEDRDAMKRLEPLVTSTRDLSVPQSKQAADALDPAPTDLPTASDPIDFSAQGSNDEEALDPAPDDIVVSSDIPQDFSVPVDIVDRAEDIIRIDAADYGEPAIPRRIQSLPGMLVGKELVKQTHVYTGAEVHVVSPLSDPSNPDATGTPVPFNRDYRVAGVFFTGMYEYDLKYVYVTLESLQDFLDRGETIDGIEVRVTDADDTERMVGELKKAVGSEYRIVDWRELNQSLFAALKLEKIVMFLVLGIVILVASFSIVGNLIMVVVEKGRQIALLKTLGASDMGVMQLFAIQGLMIGMIGTLLGIATGLGACLLGKKYGLPLDPNVYYIDRLPIHIDPSSVGAAGAAGVLISILATLYPASLAAKIRPAAGMRH